MLILDTRSEKNLIGTFISDLSLTLFSYVAESVCIIIHQRQEKRIAATKAGRYKLSRVTKYNGRTLSDYLKIYNFL